MYDSNMYSSPLSLLQLPPTALPEVTSRLTQPGNSIARFSQDGKCLTELRSMVPEADFQQAAEVTVDVGFVCKKCHMVYPAEVLCLNHQRASCFSAKPIGEIKAMLKLVQSHVECRACRERFTTVMDFKFHCDMDRHVKRVQKIQRECSNPGTKTAVPSSAPLTSINNSCINTSTPNNHFALVSSPMVFSMPNPGSSTQHQYSTAQINSITQQNALQNHGSLVRNGLPDVAQLFFSGMGMDAIRLGMGLDPETPDPKAHVPVGCNVGAGDSVSIS